MLQNGIFIVIFILFFSIFLAACGIGNIWCQLLGKRHTNPTLTVEPLACYGSQKRKEYGI